MTISEFGRRVDRNGGGGLDHGWGNMMLLFGGGVKEGLLRQLADAGGATSWSTAT